MQFFCKETPFLKIFILKERKQKEGTKADSIGKIIIIIIIIIKKKKKKKKERKNGGKLRAVCFINSPLYLHKLTSTFW